MQECVWYIVDRLVKVMHGSSPAAGYDIDCSVRERCEDSGKTIGYTIYGKTLSVCTF